MSTLAAATTASSTSSPRCVPFAFRRGGGGARGRLPPAPGAGATRTVAHGAPAAAAGGCGRPLCRAAGVVGEGIQNAFFGSLDSCSCVSVRTNSFKESESEEAAAPLVPPPRAHDDSSSSAATARTAGRRRRVSASAGGMARRGGLGCCTCTPHGTSAN